MKTRAIAISIFLGLFLLAATAPVQAQQPLRVKIPFAFVAGKVALPAGEYIVQPSQIGSPAMVLRRCDGLGNDAVIVITHPAEASVKQSESYLLFHVYGDAFFLSEMWSARNTSARQLRTSPIEKQLAKNETPHDIILVASLQ